MLKQLPSGHFAGHLFAALATLIWSTTFVASRNLINAGLRPVEIIFYRSFLAWLVLLALRPSGFRLPTSWASLKEEKLLILYGLFMLPIYFMLDNTALVHSTATNTSLLISTSPLFIVLISRFILKNERITKSFVVGSLICLGGVFFVVSGGNFALEFNPLGDFLAIGAAIAAAIFNILGERLGRENYPNDIIVRMQRIFFYGILMLFPVMFISGFRFETELVLQPSVVLQLVYLGLGASALGFIVWNKALGHIGALSAGLYIFLIPVLTIIVARIVLGEQLTIFSAIGAFLILCGLMVAKNWLVEFWLAIKK